VSKLDYLNGEINHFQGLRTTLQFLLRLPSG